MSNDESSKARDETSVSISVVDDPDDGNVSTTNGAAVGPTTTSSSAPTVIVASSNGRAGVSLATDAGNAAGGPIGQSTPLTATENASTSADQGRTAEDGPVPTKSDDEEAIDEKDYEKSYQTVLRIKQVTKKPTRATRGCMPYKWRQISTISFVISCILENKNVVKIPGIKNHLTLFSLAHSFEMLFQSFYLKKVGQGHGIQFSQGHHLMTDIKIYRNR